jgi:hypothetical protein
MINPIKVTQNDGGYPLPFALMDGNGNPLDLTNATGLAFKVQAAEDDTQTLKFTGAMDKDVALSGTCHYTVAAGNFDAPGVFNAQIVVTFPGSVTISYSDIQIKVIPALPA